jgi:hypothetical protein
MGYGGNLIWTSVFKTLNERDGRKLAPVHLPQLSDLLAGALRDRAVSLADDAIYRGNPRLVFPSALAKGRLARVLDALGRIVLRQPSLRRAFEAWISRRAMAADSPPGPRLVHVDMRLHSYAEAQDRRRTIWKPQPRAADAVLARLGGGTASLDCEFHFTAEEHAAADALVGAHGLSGGFIAIEPETNRDYFGDLRAWPADRWAAFAAALRASYPDLPVAQLGIGKGPAIPGVADLRGRTSFRIASLLLQRARLFVGTESGLMHAANAVGARALILWGGITLPEFAGYPTRQRTICKYVACAPCGHSGWCVNGHACMRTIEVDEVIAAAREELDRNGAGVAAR